MNIEIFDRHFGHLRDVDCIPVDPLCDHPHHVSITGALIGRGAARRNILKHGGKKVVCRACCMKYLNPMTQQGVKRQTNEEIMVECPECSRQRCMMKACYYGEMCETYQQRCGSCAQQGKVIPHDQRAKISDALKGRTLTKSHRHSIKKAMLNDPARLATAMANLRPGAGGGWNKGKSTPQDVRDRISAGNKGRRRTAEQRKNYSRGRLKRSGGERA